MIKCSSEILTTVSELQFLEQALVCRQCWAAKTVVRPHFYFISTQNDHMLTN